jgi:hypothetical protein
MTVPSFQFPVPSSQFPVPSSQFPVPSSQFPVFQFPVPGFPVRGVGRAPADGLRKPSTGHFSSPNIEGLIMSVMLTKSEFPVPSFRLPFPVPSSQSDPSGFQFRGQRGCSACLGSQMLGVNAGVCSRSVPVFQVGTGSDYFRRGSFGTQGAQGNDRRSWLGFPNWKLELETGNWKLEI